MKLLFTFLLLLWGFGLQAQLFFRAGDTNADAGRDVVRDQFGDTYVVMTISGGTDVELNPKGTSVKVRSTGTASDIVLAKYSASGILSWHQKIGNTGDDVVHAVALDALDRVMIVGYFTGVVSFDPLGGAPGSQMFSNGQREGFLAAYATTDGGFVYVNPIGGIGNDEVLDVEADNSGNIFVVGSFSDEVDFNASSPGNAVFAMSSGARDFFLAKYDAIGELQWVAPLGGIEDDPGQQGRISLKVDALGDPVVAGTFRTTVDFNPTPGNSFLTSLAEEDIFVAKYVSDGNLRWVKGVGTPATDFATSVTIDSDNNVIVTGSVGGTGERILAYTEFDVQSNIRPSTISNGDVFLGKFDQADGTMLWANIMGGTGIDFGTVVSTGNGNNVYLGANFQGTIDADPSPASAPLTSFASGANFDFFRAKYNTDGEYEWAFQYGSGTGVNSNLGCWMNPNDEHCIITGRFHASVVFDPPINGQQLASAGDADIFVAEYDANGLLKTAQSGNCPVIGNDLTFTNISPTRATFQFNPVAGPETYTLRYRPVGSQTFIEYEGIFTTPDAIDGLTPNTQYEACVVSVCAGGVKSACSNLVRFQTSAQQSCDAPVLSLGTVTASTAMLSWSPNDLTQYVLEIKRNNGPFTRQPAQSNPSPFVLQGLFANTNYEVRLVKLCGGGLESSPSNTVAFRTLDGQPLCPTPVVSSSDITENSAKISWTPSNIGYELQIREEGETTFNPSTGSGGTVTLQGLKKATTYEVRVRNQCPGNTTSEFSLIHSFTTLDNNPCTPPAFGLKTVTTTTAEIFWLDSTLKKYELSYKRNVPTGDWITFANVDFASPFKIETLFPGEEYMVRMRRVCPGGVISEYSDTLIFTTFGIQCRRPVIKIDTTENRAVVVSWSPSSVSAEVQYRFPSVLEWNTFTVSNQNSARITGLLPGVTYEFRVRNVCGTAVSEYSEPIRTITVAFPPCPVPQITVETIGSKSVIVNWTPKNLPFYEISFRANGEDEWNELADNIEPPFVIEAFEPLTGYEIRMRAVCNDDQFSDYSEVKRFVTKSDQPCDAPFLTIDSVATNALKLNWTPSANFAEIQYRPINGTNWLSVSTNRRPPFVLTNLSPNTTYYVRVRNSCTGEVSEFSNQRQTTTRALPVDCPVPLVSVSEITLTTAEIAWTPATDIYEVTYRPLGSLRWERIIRNSPQPVILTNLMEGREYEVRVRNYCNQNGKAGFSDYSKIDTFVTEFPQPVCETPTFTISNVETNRFTVNVSPTEGNMEIYVRPRNGGNWRIFFTDKQASYVVENLSIQTEYEVKVRRFCGEIFSDFAPTQFVTTKTPPPPPCGRPLVTISGTPTNTRAAINWIRGTAMIELSYKATTDSVWKTENLVRRPPYTLTELLPCTSYEVRIRNYCSGEFSEYATATFSTNCPPPPNCPTPTIALRSVNDASITVGWDIGMDFYEYSIRPKGGAWSTRFANDTVQVFNNLMPETEYEIRFRQYCDNAELSLYSNVLTVTTSAKPITCPVPATVSVTNITAKSAFVQWNRPEGVKSFRILYWTPGLVARTTAIVTNDFVSLVNLRAGTRYEFRVKSICADGSESEYSEITAFTTLTPKSGLAEGETQFSVYPNPNKGLFTVQLQESTPATLKLYDLNGKTVWSSVTNGEHEIAVTLDQMTAGIYLLSVQTGAGIERRMKVVIE
jgi:hypothetical protein